MTRGSKTFHEVLGSTRTPTRLRASTSRMESRTRTASRTTDLDTP